MRLLLALPMLIATTATAADLNHFFITLDHETYAAIEGSDFLKSEFAAFEKRTTVRTDRAYTAIYLYGRHTYFELFDAVQAKRNPGGSGIAFGVDATVDEPKQLPLEKHLITREWQGVQLPWFYNLSGAGGPDFDVWLMEYHPDFLKKWHPGLAGPAGSIAREAVLQRYKAVLPQTPKDPMLEDVSGVTVAATAEERQPIIKWLQGIGFESPVQFVDVGKAERGIREVRFKLRRSPAMTHELHFGGASVLRLRPDGTAVWSF